MSPDRPRKSVNSDRQRAAARKLGLSNVANGHLARITTTETRSKGGSAGLKTVLANDPGHQSRAGKLGGKIGGKIQGTENARIGWMQHVALVRWGSRHTNCEYCNRQRVHQQNLQNL